MHEISTVDGFVEITECSAEMIKYLANEPSAGLFYIQQHTQNAVPNVIKLEKNVTNKSHETTLHTQDSDDSITMLSLMKECGLPTADEMIREIKKSLAIMSTKQPRRGLIRNPNSNFHAGITSSWGSASWGRPGVFTYKDGEGSSYISTVFKSAREKASGTFKWQQPLGPKELLQTRVEKLDKEGNELPVLSHAADKSRQDDQVDVSLPGSDVWSMSKSYDEFKAGKENELQDWLEDKR